jgi:hypothetical protein
MVRYKNYIAGWLDSSIHDFLIDFPPTFNSMKYALITCLDSNREPCSLLRRSPELEPIKKWAQPLGKGLLLPTRLLLDAESSDQLLFGFDEVWFFASDQVEPKPSSAWLVGPRRIDQEKINTLGTWMSRNSCSLGLGDGEGLNFVVRARGLISYVIGHSMNQLVST